VRIDSSRDQAWEFESPHLHSVIHAVRGDVAYNPHCLLVNYIVLGLQRLLQVQEEIAGHYLPNKHAVPCRDVSQAPTRLFHEVGLTVKRHKLNQAWNDSDIEYFLDVPTVVVLELQPQS